MVSHFHNATSLSKCEYNLGCLKPIGTNCHSTNQIYFVLISKPYGRAFRKGGNGRFDRDGRQGKGGGGKGGFRGDRSGGFSSGGGGKNQTGWYKVTVCISVPHGLSLFVRFISFGVNVVLFLFDRYHMGRNMTRSGC